MRSRDGDRAGGGVCCFSSRGRHTRCGRDWSSDVCSSDLDTELRFASNEADSLHAYLAQDRNVSDLLLTGGDPMVMRTRHLVNYLEPFLQPKLEHLQTIRIGTKSLTFWPQRFVTDPDADELLRLFEIG